MTATYTTVGGINPLPRTLEENNQNWARLSKYLTAGGLTVTAGGALGVSVTPPLDSSSGSIALDLAAAGALNVIAGTLAVAVDGTTLAIVADAISVKAGGIGSAQLGVLTTKGDLLGYTTAHVRIPVGADGKVLTADSSQLAGVGWEYFSAPINYASTSPFVDLAGNIYYMTGTKLTDAAGNLYSSGGVLIAKVGGLYNGNGQPLTDSGGNIYYGSGNPLADSGGDLYYNTGVQFVTSTASINYGNGNTLSDSSGTLYYGDGTTVLANASGNLSGNNLTLTGSITIPAKSANTFYSGPASGAAAVPTFRSLVSADVPPILHTTTFENSSTACATLYANATTGSGTIQLWQLNGVTKATMASNGTLTLTGDVSAASANFSANVSVGNNLNITGDCLINAISGTTTTPRLLGLQSLGAARFQFGDAFNCIQAAFGDRQQWIGYWGLEIHGNAQGAAVAFAGGGGSDASLNVVGVQTGAPVLAASGPSGLTNDVIQGLVNGSRVHGLTATGAPFMANG